MGCSSSTRARRVHSLRAVDCERASRETHKRGAKPKRKGNRAEKAYPPEKAVVFLFAVDVYLHQLPLTAAVADAVALGNALATLGFTVKGQLFNENCTLSALQRELRCAADALCENTRVLVFFAGHGMLDPKTQRTFYCTHETRSDALVSTAFDIEQIFLLTDFFPRHQAWVLDCCYSGGACSSVRRGSGYKKTGSPSVQIVSAGRAGEEVLETRLATPQISPLVTPETSPNNTPDITPVPSPTHGNKLRQPPVHADAGRVQPLKLPRLLRQNVKSKGIFTSFFIRELKRHAQRQRRQATQITTLTDIFIRIRSDVQRESARWGHAQTPQMGRAHWYRDKRAEGEFVF